MVKQRRKTPTTFDIAPCPERKARGWRERLWMGAVVAAGMVAQAAPPADAPPRPAPTAQPAPSIFDDGPPAPPPKSADPQAVKLLPTGPASAPTPAEVDPPITPPSPGETPAQSIERIYGPRVQRAEDSQKKRDQALLALQMFQDALQLPTPTELQRLLLHKAYDMGMRGPFGYDTALAAVQNLGRLYPEEKAQADDKELDLYEKASNTPHVNLKRVAGYYIGKIETMAAEFLTKGNFESAITLYERSIRAEKIISKDAAWHQQDRIRALRDRNHIRKRIEGLKRRLQQTPDPTTATELVRLVLLDGDDLFADADGLPLVEQSLREVATSASLTADKLNEAQAKQMADWLKINYIQSAYGKITCLERARLGYERALALHVPHDVMWLEIRSSLTDLQNTRGKMDAEIAAKRKAEERRDTTVITTPALKSRASAN